MDHSYLVENQDNSDQIDQRRTSGDGGGCARSDALRGPQMTGDGSKLGRKLGQAVAALLREPSAEIRIHLLEAATARI